MREVKRKPDESLDDAFKRLQEIGKKEHVYMKFEKHNIFSSYTIDDAYKEVYGMSRDKYFAKQTISALVSEALDEEESRFDDSPSDVIRDMRTAILIGDIDADTGEYHSEIAKNYIRKMSKYAKYCKEEVKDEWKQSITYYIYCIGKLKDNGEEEFSDDQIEAYLDFYEKLGKIMELMSQGPNWSEVKNLVMSYNLSSDDIESLKECMLHYSILGNDFITNVFGKGPKTLNKKDNN